MFFLNRVYFYSKYIKQVLISSVLVFLFSYCVYFVGVQSTAQATTVRAVNIAQTVDITAKKRAESIFKKTKNIEIAIKTEFATVKKIADDQAAAAAAIFKKAEQAEDGALKAALLEEAFKIDYDAIQTAKRLVILKKSVDEAIVDTGVAQFIVDKNETAFKKATAARTRL